MSVQGEVRCSQVCNRRPAIRGPTSKLHVTITPDRVTSELRKLYSTEFLNQQSNQVEDNERAHISCLCTDQKLIATYHDGIETLHDGFQRGLSISGDNKCLGWRDPVSESFQWMTYKEVNARATAFGAGLISLGLSQSNETRVGIYSQNRLEYVISTQALYKHSMTAVPLYDTLGESASVFIINQAELSVIICDNSSKVFKLLMAYKQIPVLKTLIVIDVVEDDKMALANKLGIQLLHFPEVEKLGKAKPVTEKPPTPNDLCMVCYTSGTTGAPKGAMLTHRNIMACVSGGLTVLNASGLAFTTDDCLVSYLPLAHSYEQVMEAAVLMSGAHIGFFGGDIKKLMVDIRDLKPTIFPSVPRLLNRFYDKIMAGLSANKIKSYLFHKALKSKSSELKSGIIRNNSYWDKLVFHAVQMALGGRVRVITTGSAPISDNVLSVLRCIVGCPIIEGYGQTESSAVCAMTLVGDCEPGHVGPPLPCSMIKMVDVPEMNYFAKDNKGEICVTGPNVFKGYLKDEEKTNEALDAGGWLHTGDIGEWLPNGTLKIIDRKKNIFKLAQGEYIAPEKIENILVQSPWVAQAYVHGDSLQPFIVAIIVPDSETLPNLATKLDVKGNMSTFIKSKEIKDQILSNLTEIGKRNGLTSLELVKDIKLVDEMFSVENNLLTPTMKLKRHVLVKLFADDFADMYATLPRDSKY